MDKATERSIYIKSNKASEKRDASFLFYLCYKMFLNLLHASLVVLSSKCQKKNIPHKETSTSRS